MKTTKKKGMMFTMVMAVLLTFMTAYDAGARGKMKGQEGAMKGQSGAITGQLVSVNSDRGSITIESEVQGLSGPEKKVTEFKVADDAKWHICLAGNCSDKVGADGLRTVSEYIGKEASGASMKNAKVTLYQEGNIVTALNIDIAAPESSPRSAPETAPEM